MVMLNDIPHINEISNHGLFAGTAEKKTATFRQRYHQQNKVVPSLEEAIRRTGLRDGMTISFHHHSAMATTSSIWWWTSWRRWAIIT